MTIPLPPLPEPDFALDQGDEPCYYAHTLRAIQREAMRAAIEAAADSIQGRGHNSFEFAELIRKLEIA